MLAAKIEIQEQDFFFLNYKKGISSNLYNFSSLASVYLLLLLWLLLYFLLFYPLTQYQCWIPILNTKKKKKSITCLDVHLGIYYGKFQTFLSYCFNLKWKTITQKGFFKQCKVLKRYCR